MRYHWRRGEGGKAVIILIIFLWTKGEKAWENGFDLGTFDDTKSFIVYFFTFMSVQFSYTTSLMRLEVPSSRLLPMLNGL